MKLPTFLLLGLALIPTLTSAQVSFGSSTLINDGWGFALGDQDAARLPSPTDPSWQRVDLPHDWSIGQPLDPKLASATGYLPGGIGWYVKALPIAREDGGEKVFIYFEGVYNHSEVYLNGHLLGKRPNGYVSFIYDATPYVNFGQDNLLAVRVDHSRSADSRWYTGSGIYRNVFLIRAHPLHITPWGVFVRAEAVDKSAALLQIETELQNETAQAATVVVKHEVLSAAGAVVAEEHAEIKLPAGAVGKAALSLKVTNPTLWSTATPYLYQVRTTIIQDGRQLDQALTRTGIRRLAFDADKGFSLNGVGMKLKGVCIHHDAGVLGAAVPRTVWKKRLQTLKGLGANAIRLSHNPHAPDVYELCDELGLLVMDEAYDEWEYPKRKWLSGWNVGQPGFEGSWTYFEEWKERDIAAMVRRDRNHPSVFAWSIGNEIDYPNDPYSHPVLERARIDQPMLPGYKPDHPNASRLGPIAEHLAAEVRKHDPSRPVTAALAGVVMSNETGYPAALDVVGYNYTEDRYAGDHQKYPRRIIYGSENRHSHAAWKAVRDNAAIAGQFLWTGIDYLGEAGAWPARGSTAGLLDLTGAVKPRGRFREALWSDKPVIYLGTQAAPKDDRKSIDARPLWNYAPGTPVRVLCYTNAAKARLLLNGRPVGGDKPRDDEEGVIAWDLPFEAGKLEVIGMDEQDGETCRNALQSAGAPAAFLLSSDAKTLAAGHGVVELELQVVDQHGVAVPDASPAVTCSVEGPARLLGLEAGDIHDVSDYTDAVQHAYHGRIVAYVQATGVKGTVRVRFTAPELPEASVELTIE